jgi:hypothetical protein
MLRRIAMCLAGTLVLCLGARPVIAGQWKYAYEAGTNMFDFSVGNGILYWVDIAGASPYYGGNTTCAWGNWSSLTVTHNPNWGCDFGYASTFPNGHAQRVAVGYNVNYPNSPYTPQYYVATAEGKLWNWNLNQGAGKWYFTANLPSGLTYGYGTNSVYRLIFDKTNGYTGAPPANPIWLLGSNGHIYHLIGSAPSYSWIDASVSNGIGPVAQLSYSAVVEAMVCTWADGTSAYYDENAQGWYYITPAAIAQGSGFPVGPETALGYSTISPNAGVGGLFQAWSSLPTAPNGSYSTTFVVGLWSNWYYLSTNPTVPGYPAITGASFINSGAAGSWYDAANPGLSAAVARQPEQEIPINMVEGNYLAYNRTLYGGGPHDTGYTDLLWVQTDALRVYFYED